MTGHGVLQKFTSPPVVADAGPGAGAAVARWLHLLPRPSPVIALPTGTPDKSSDCAAGFACLREALVFEWSGEATTVCLS